MDCNNMSLIECVRDECGKIMQNRNGQYFFVCSKCDLEFVTLWSFLDHLNDSHDSKDFRNQSDDLTIPFTKKLPYGRTRITGSEDAIIFEREDVRDIKVENNSSDMFTDDCSEPVHKANAVLRTVSKSEPRRAILVSPKPKKPARRVALVPSFGKRTSSGGSCYSSEQEEAVRDMKDENNFSDASSMEDCSEPVLKVNADFRTASKYEPRRAILVSPKSKPKSKKPARSVALVKSFGKGTSSGGGRYSSFQSSSNRVRPTEQNSGKYECKNCRATFSTMINLDSHEVVCLMLPMRLYCDRCNCPFDDKIGLQTHKKYCR